MHLGFLLFFGNKKWYMPVCFKVISVWLRKVLNIAKAHMILNIVCGTVA